MRKVEWCVRFPRLAVLAALVIYAGLLLLYYRSSLPLRTAEGPRPPSAATAEENSGYLMEQLLVELDQRAGLERDGPLVPDGPSNDSAKLLESIFYRADVNADGLLDIKELARWIHAKIIDHIDRAMSDNIGLFTNIDNNPRNGEITWDEYHGHFLRSHGLSDSYVSSHDKRHSALSRQLKEAIMRDRARWAEAARNEPDKLTLDEFLAFTHPESSHRALLQMVEDLFDKFDRDGDEQLTEDEFSDLPLESATIDQNLSMPVSQERREEFRHLIDRNRDGRADRAELLAYIDPRNPRHAIQESRHLIDLSDIDHDGKLKLSEILSKMDLFLGSKMVDTEGSFHDEFR